MTGTEPMPLLTTAREVPPGSTRDAVDEALAWQCLKDAVGALADQARERARAAMLAQASEKQAVLDAAGDRMGTVTLAQGDLRVDVLNRARLIEYVQANFPSEIVPDVRSTFIHVLLQSAVEQAREDGVTSGEVLPGIYVGEAEPVLRITKTKVAREMGQRIAARVLGAFEDRHLGS